MYKIDDIGSFFMSLPPNLQRAETKAFGYAVDRQFKKLMRLADMLNVWGELDKLDPKYYDMAAAILRAPYYRSDYDDGQKLRLIKSALATYRYAGSVRAIKELLTNIYSEAEFVPWYDYGGEPYHFKVRTDAARTPEMDELFRRILRKVKAARSKLDTIEVLRESYAITYAGGIGDAVILAKEIGEFPDDAYAMAYAGGTSDPVILAQGAERGETSELYL